MRPPSLRKSIQLIAEYLGVDVTTDDFEEEFGGLDDMFIKEVGVACKALDNRKFLAWQDQKRYNKLRRLLKMPPLPG